MKEDSKGEILAPEEGSVVCGRGRWNVTTQVLSSGIRVGFVSGPPAFMNRLNLHSQSTNLHVSGLSQAMVLALLRHWGASL